jgi:hypothetical protein
MEKKDWKNNIPYIGIAITAIIAITTLILNYVPASKPEYKILSNTIRENRCELMRDENKEFKKWVEEKFADMTIQLNIQSRLLNKLLLNNGKNK